jgi:outer membrane immunogenic protein
MRKLLLAGTTFVALTGTPALAADMPLKAPPLAPAPVWTWTGFYIGGNVGYGWGTGELSAVFGSSFSPAQAAALTPLATPTLKPQGVLGGVQAGYNFQNGNFLVGVEADFDLSGIKASQSTGSITFPLGLALLNRSFSEADRLKWLSTGRARAGLTMSNWLAYVTGGVAVGQRDFTQAIITDVNFNNLVSTTSATKVGWTVGGGLEYMAARNWTVKAEYLFVDLGSISTFADSNTAPGFGVNVTTSEKLTLHIARVGVNYKFEWAGPVVAKY